MNQPERLLPAGRLPSAPVAIRPMTAADLPAVIAIAAACPEAPHWRPEDYRSYADANPQSGFLRAGFVALLDGSILGFAAASLLAASSGYPDPESQCELDSMAVHPDLRRRGIGAALFSAVLTWAREHHARRLILEVRAGNSAALALYHRFGLRQESCRPRYYADPEEDALLLGMAVTAGSATPSFSTEKAVEGGPPRC